MRRQRESDGRRQTGDGQAETIPSLALGALTLLALGLRLYRLGAQSLWIDEVSSVEVAAQSLADIVTNYQPGRHPWHGSEQAPLAFAVMHLFYRPDAIEVSARLPFALLGSMTVPAVYFCARQWVDKHTALLAAALLAVAPLHVWYSQDARWYALWMLLSTLTYRALARMEARPRRTRLLAYIVISILNVYTFLLSFLLMFCQGVSLLLLRGQRTVRLRWFVAAGVMVVVASTPVLWMVMHTLGLVTGTPRPTSLAQVPYTFFAYLAGYSVGPSLTELHSLPRPAAVLREHPVVPLFAAIYGFLMVLGLRAALRQPHLAAWLLPWAFGPASLVLLLSSVSNITYQARYSAAALPAILLLVALGITSLRRKSWCVLATAAVIACSAYALAHHYWNPRYSKEDARAVVEALRSEKERGPVYVLGQVGPAVAFYGPDLAVRQIEHCDGDGEGWAAAPASLWLVVGRDWEGQGPGCRRKLASSHALVQLRTFAGIEAWHYRVLGAE